MNPILGIFYHAIGGFAAGSFYIPYGKVKDWRWEVYWLTGGEDDQHTGERANRLTGLFRKK